MVLSVVTTTIKSSRSAQIAFNLYRSYICLRMALLHLSLFLIFIFPTTLSVFLHSYQYPSLRQFHPEKRMKVDISVRIS